MSTHGGGRRVVVGVDGSEQAARAVRWAARQARRRGATLRLVTAWEPTPEWVPGMPSAAHSDSDRRLRAVAERALSEAAAQVPAEAGPTVPLEQDIVVGSPVEVLVAESRSADVLVVGERGWGRISAALVGSVAAGVTSLAQCPVVVVRGDERADAGTLPVVVGVDGSPVGEAAIAFAYAEAAARGVPLVALHTWWDAYADPQFGALVDQRALEVDEEELLAERLAGWAQKYPEVPVTRVVARDQPAHALLERSAQAQLVVTGSRGRGQLAGLVLGSVSHRLVHASACPVAVVRPQQD